MEIKNTISYPGERRELGDTLYSMFYVGWVTCFTRLGNHSGLLKTFYFKNKLFIAVFSHYILLSPLKF